MIKSKKLAYQRFLNIWNTLDTNGNGWTDADEAWPGLESTTNTEWSRYTIDQFLQIFDKNHDGKVGMLEMWMVSSNE